MSDYFDHVPNNAGEASLQLTHQQDAKKGKISGQQHTDSVNDYKIAYNWPYDYISIIETARLDIEVLYRADKGQAGQKRELVQKSNSRRTQKRAKKAALPAMAPLTGKNKKGGGGKY